LGDYANRPDLVEARGEDGTAGYVYVSELFPERGSNPEEVLRLQAEREERGPYTINLYESDGVTIIGKYWKYP
jgi:hypothetical protein